MGSVRTMVVLGSGGHTAEMLTLVDKLDKDFYQPRCYVVAATDSHSAEKALRAEREALKAQDEDAVPAGVAVARIPRSREVGQSYITSVWTTLVALCSAFLLVLRESPGVILVNGPGTCIPICFSAWLLRLLCISSCKIIYIESIARVTSLSLSGKILYHGRIADSVFVQWPKLCDIFPRTEYGGRLY